MPPKKPDRARVSANDPVEVFCRIRALGSADECCATVSSGTTIDLRGPESGQTSSNGSRKEMRYSFKGVFSESASQQQVYGVVARPLVQDLLEGKNGLLMNYGVTGSGKTYTMMGSEQDAGFMPRCLNSLFSSLEGLQAGKNVFRPDKMNGFDVQSEADAMLERQRALYKTPVSKVTSKTPKRLEASKVQEPYVKSLDPDKINAVDEDSIYAVFVTNIEIYNNSTYDLLENSSTLQTKVLREDTTHMMYLHGATEVEVQSAQEALDVFLRGQSKRRVAHTLLNSESSRSHCIFNIRLVQAPLDAKGEDVIRDSGALCVSQLSLVDLAGSERTTRTKNTGCRLREAGNINNSLMTLRTCMEIMRENQMEGSNRIVPYRDSKLTHYFKSFFENQGKVRMVVCINPRAADHDENTQVLRFAEKAQEVQVERPVPVHLDLGLLSGRRRAHEHKDIRKDLEEHVSESNVLVDFNIPIHSLGPDFPSFDIKTAEDMDSILDIERFLEKRLVLKRAMVLQQGERQIYVRERIVQLEQENTLLKHENGCLKVQWNNERAKVQRLESRVSSLKSSYEDLWETCGQKERALTCQEIEMREKESRVTGARMETEKARAKFRARLEAEKEKMGREMSLKLECQKLQMQKHMRVADDETRAAKRVMQGRVPRTPRFKVTCSSDSEVQETRDVGVEISRSAKRSVAAANPRHRRSRSVEEGMWLDHVPARTLELTTVLQPTLRKRKSVTNVAVRDVVNSKASRYCLTTQEQDSAGEVETKLYKGDVIPTCGGGAQVIFQDVEILKQLSPTSGMKRSLRDEKTATDVGERCFMAIEGHGKRLKDKP